MRKKPPCSQDCFDRTMTCHQFCQRYKDWKKEDQQRKAEKDAAKEIEWITFTDRSKKALHRKIMKGRK